MSNDSVTAPRDKTKVKTSHDWVSAAPAWITLLIVLIGGVYAFGVKDNQQEANTNFVTKQMEFNDQIRHELSELKTNINNVDSRSVSNSSRLDKMDLAMQAIYKIQSDVSGIAASQGHIQNGLSEVKDDVSNMERKIDKIRGK